MNNDNSPASNDDPIVADIDPDFQPLVSAEVLEEAVPTGPTARLHPNLLAQIDAAFRRHHWLVTSTGVGELLDQHCRSSNRGRKKQGLDGALFYALQLTAVFTTGQATIEQMYVIAQSLPLTTRLEFGIVDYRNRMKVRELTRKQLYSMNEGLGRNLDYTNPGLAEAEQALPEEDQEVLIQARQTERHAVVNEIVRRLLSGTHLIEISHGTYAIDDTGIWAWPKAPRGSRYKPGGQDRPLVDEDTSPRPQPDEAGAQRDPNVFGGLRLVQTEAADNRRDPSSWRCQDAAWGGKTKKDGSNAGVYGYKAHVIVNTNDPAQKVHLPVLIQALELTPANADIVDVSFRLIDQIRTRNAFHRLIGDRHYGYKEMDRWAMQLWRRGIHQVLDLRDDKPGPVDQYGAKVIDGRPHCPALGTHLENLAPSDDETEQQTFKQQVGHREAFAFRMVKGPLASPGKIAAGEDDPKVGFTRWQCPAAAGRVGCPLREGTVTQAREKVLPVVQNPPRADYPEELPKCCVQETIQIEPDRSMKYLQEEYWGSRKWRKLYALRSAVEGVFGNIKNRGTEDVRRGFMQVTGLPLVTLAVAAAAACYNIRILEKHSREAGERIESPLMNHPLDGEIIESLLLRGDEVFEHVERLSQTAA